MREGVGCRECTGNCVGLCIGCAGSCVGHCLSCTGTAEGRPFFSITYANNTTKATSEKTEEEES